MPRQASPSPDLVPARALALGRQWTSLWDAATGAPVAACPDRSSNRPERGPRGKAGHPQRTSRTSTILKINYAAVRDGTGPARLLDMVAGRSQQAFKTWLTDRPQAWRDVVEVGAMDGFTGFKTAAAEEVPDPVAVMDPFHVVPWPVMPSTAAGDGSSSRSTVTVASTTTRSTRHARP